MTSTGARAKTATPVQKSLSWACAVVLAFVGQVHAFAQSTDEAGSLELVDPKVFRACGDPRNMPFSNEKV